MNSDLRDRDAERVAAIEEIEAAFVPFVEHGREPDAWERQCLTEAINCIFRGAYMLATTNAHLALTPPAERSPGAQLDPSYDRFDLAALQKGFAEACRAPVRPYPHFGPIIVRGE